MSQIKEIKEQARRLDTSMKKYLLAEQQVKDRATRLKAMINKLSQGDRKLHDEILMPIVMKFMTKAVKVKFNLK